MLDSDKAPALKGAPCSGVAGVHHPGGRRERRWSFSGCTAWSGRDDSQRKQWISPCPHAHTCGHPGQPHPGRGKVPRLCGHKHGPCSPLLCWLKHPASTVGCSARLDPRGSVEMWKCTVRFSRQQHRWWKRRLGL